MRSIKYLFYSIVLIYFIIYFSLLFSFADDEKIENTDNFVHVENYENFKKENNIYVHSNPGKEEIGLTLLKADNNPRYYYAKLDDRLKELYAFFKYYLDGFNEHYNSVVFQEDGVSNLFACFQFKNDKDISFTHEELDKVIVCLRDDYPEYFWFGWYSDTKWTDSDLVKDVYFKVHQDVLNETKRVHYQFTIEKNMQEYLTLVKDKKSELDKELVLHDTLCKNLYYTLDKKGNPLATLECHSILGPFTTKEAVCEAYARAFSLLLYKTGILNHYVVGNTSTDEDNPGRHAWNQVYIDGIWYNVDVTWDDNSKSYGYGNFNKDDEYFIDCHIQDNGAFYEVCSTKTNLPKITIKNKKLSLVTVKYTKNAYNRGSDVNFHVVLNKGVDRNVLNAYVLEIIYNEKIHRYCLGDGNLDDGLPFYLDFAYTNEAPQYYLRKAISLTCRKSTIKVGDKQQIFAEISSEDAISSWKVSNTSIAKINKKGVLTAKKKGKVYVTCTLKNGCTQKIKIKVKPSKNTFIEID